MRISSVLAVCVVAGATVVIHGATRTVDFSADAVGQPPRGFQFGHTAKIGAPGTWVVQADGNNKYLAQTNADSTGSQIPRGGVDRRQRGGRRPVGPFQTSVGKGRPGGGARLAIPERGQLLHRPRERAREQRRVVQGRARQTHRPAVEARGAHLRQEGTGAVRAVEHAPGCRDRAASSRCTSTARRSSRWRTRRSRKPARSASGPRLIL